MKIDVTYEKLDVLRLVRTDLASKGLHIKAGTDLEYKGALHVKLSVEVEDDAPMAVPSHPPTAPKENGATTPALIPTPAPDEGDMASILAESNKVAAATTPKFEVKPGKARPLGANESYEFPKE